MKIEYEIGVYSKKLLESGKNQRKTDNECLGLRPFIHPAPSNGQTTSGHSRVKLNPGEQIHVRNQCHFLESQGRAELRLWAAECSRGPADERFGPLRASFAAKI